MTKTAKMRDVIQETIYQMDVYHYWHDEDVQWGPEPERPTVETVVKALKSKNKSKEFTPNYISIEVESTPEAPLTLRDLVVGETFSFSASYSPKNVYMVIGEKGGPWTVKSGDTTRKCVMLKNGCVYEHNIDSYVRRRSCSLKVAP